MASLLPPGSTFQQVAYVSAPSSHQVLLVFPPPISRRAVLVGSAPDPQAEATGDLSILTVPCTGRETLSESESELFTHLRTWVEAASPAHSSPSLMMTFQGTQLCWTPGRIAILAQPDRLESVRRAMIEASFYDFELRNIESSLGERWPQLEADMPLAFEFDQNSMSQRKQLRQRFQQVILSRSQLTRISMQVHTPHLHPPTLASQISERFRDRTRMEHRYEILDEQLEVFEQVYEMCGQRASDFQLAHSGHKLEWIIIVLLLAQSVLYGFELLMSQGQVP